MGLFEIDKEKCKKDGLCVAECPMGILRLEKNDPVPVQIDELVGMCIQCGHCVAVCPEGALTHEYLRPDQCPPVREDWLLDPERAEHFLRSRRSIRNFKEKHVDREVLARLIDVAHCAPSGHNSQAVEWKVIGDAEGVQKAAGFVVDWMQTIISKRPEAASAMGLDHFVATWENGKDIICRKAPHMIIVHAPVKEPTGAQACTIAMTYLDLAAPSFGLGTCWAGFFALALNKHPAMQEALGLPEGHACHGAVMAGYPRFKYHRMPLRNDVRITWT